MLCPGGARRADSDRSPGAERESGAGRAGPRAKPFGVSLQKASKGPTPGGGDGRGAPAFRRPRPGDAFCRLARAGLRGRRPIRVAFPGRRSREKSRPGRRGRGQGKAEDRRQKAEDRRQNAEGGRGTACCALVRHGDAQRGTGEAGDRVGQKTEDRRQKSEDRTMTAAGAQHAVPL